MIYLCLTLALAVPFAILNAFAITLLWGWFVVPIAAVPPLTIPYAMGLGILVSYVTQQIDLKTILQRTDSKEQLRELFVSQAVYYMLKPAFAIGCGWIITLFL